jgi:hypothetical protein
MLKVRIICIISDVEGASLQWWRAGSIELSYAEAPHFAG